MGFSICKIKSRHLESVKFSGYNQTLGEIPSTTAICTPCQVSRWHNKLGLWLHEQLYFCPSKMIFFQLWSFTSGYSVLQGMEGKTWSQMRTAPLKKSIGVPVKETRTHSSDWNSSLSTALSTRKHYFWVIC